MRVLSRPSVAALLGALPVSLASAQDAPILVTDLLRLRMVQSVDVSGVSSASSAGKLAVVVVNGIDPAHWSGNEIDYAPVSTLWSIDLDGETHPRQLSYGPASDTQAAISPDGKSVAFVRTPRRPRGEPEAGSASLPPDPDVQPQLWLLSLEGGEARRLTHMPGGAAAPAWSPDGRLLAFTSRVRLVELPGVPPWTLERPGRTWEEESRRGALARSGPLAGARGSDSSGDAPGPLSEREWLDLNEANSAVRVVSRLDFVDDQRVRGDWMFEEVFTVDVERVEVPPKRVTGAFTDHRRPVFSRDGRRIYSARARFSTQAPDRLFSNEIASVDVDGAHERAVVGREGFTFEDPAPSPDGSAIAFRGRAMDEPAFRQWMIGAAPSDGGEVIWLTEALDRSIFRFEWHTAPSDLIFTVADRGGFPLLGAGTGLLAPIDLAREETGQPLGVHGFGAGGDAIVFARTTPKEPCVLMLRDASGERRLWDLNPWARRAALSMPRRIAVERPARDGVEPFTMDAWLMEPPNRRSSHKYPLLVAIHGGPNAMWGPGEGTTWHELQWFCSRGYGVLYCNPRGSGGYGHAFERGNYRDWGPGPSGDVLAAVDATINEPWIDRDRMVVAGGSYGGYLTSFVITRDKRFKAAVADRGVYDFTTFFGEGSAWRLADWAFGGLPFDAALRDIYAASSPLASRRSPPSGLFRVETPLLIMHGESDRRTGIAQSEVLYRALKELGRPVEYVRYPDADHDLSRRGNPKQRIDRLLRTAEFFERFIGPAR